MSLVGDIQRRIWERREAELAPSWAAKYAKEDAPQDVLKIEGYAFPAALDMPAEMVEPFKQLARFNIEERARNFDARLTAALDEDWAHECEVEEKDREAIFAVRESTYIRHVKNRTGEVISSEAYEKARAGRAQLEEDTIELAMKLESVGSAALGSGPTSWLVDPVTGESKALVNVRNRVFLPTAAAKKRAPMIAALELLLRRQDHKYDLFCTFTGGKRAPLIVANDGAEVRAGMQLIQRRISKLNAQPFMRLAGASILWRSSELGGLEEDFNKETGKAVDVIKTVAGGKRLLVRERGQDGKTYTAARYTIGKRQHKDAAGNWLFHLHVHCLIHLERFLDGKEGRPSMSDLTRQIWDHWQDHWSIDGAIEKVREACKYVVKPAELKLLSALELAALDVALFRLHRAQPLGELKEQIKHRRENCLTVKRERRAVRDGREIRYELRPVVLADWNARKKNRIETAEQKERREQMAKRNALKKAVKNRFEAERKAEEETAQKTHEKQAEMLRWNAEHGTESVIPPAVVERKKAVYRPAPHSRRNHPPVAWQNRIVARLSPAPYFGRIASPALLVWSDQRPDLAALRLHGFVRDIVAAAEPLVRKARAGLRSEASRPGPHEVSVHTNPVTVRGDPPTTPHLPALLRPQAWQMAETTA